MILTTKKQMLDILKDTVEFYGKDPVGRISIDRAVGGCMYEMLEKNPRRCAIGRLCTDEQMVIARTCDEDLYDLNMLLLDADLPRFTPESFWQVVQNLHDGPQYWGKTGISEEGKDRAELLVENIEKGDYGGE